MGINPESGRLVSGLLMIKDFIPNWRYEKHIWPVQANRKVEACFWQPGEATGTMMRVAGEIEFLDDQELKKRF